MGLGKRYDVQYAIIMNLKSKSIHSRNVHTVVHNFHITREYPEMLLVTKVR